RALHRVSLPRPSMKKATPPRLEEQQHVAKPRSPGLAAPSFPQREPLEHSLNLPVPESPFMGAMLFDITMLKMQTVEMGAEATIVAEQFILRSASEINLWSHAGLCRDVLRQRK